MEIIKKRDFVICGLFLSVFLIIISPNITSAEIIKLPKTDYFQSETLQAEISGGFAENINLQDISFYKENQKISLMYDLAKINNIYYLYALLPDTIGNYSFVLEDISFFEDNDIVKKDIQKNFTITESQETVIQFKPGFVVTNDDFQISFENKGDSTESILIQQ